MRELFGACVLAAVRYTWRAMTNDFPPWARRQQMQRSMAAECSRRWLGICAPWAIPFTNDRL